MCEDWAHSAGELLALAKKGLKGPVPASQVSTCSARAEASFLAWAASMWAKLKAREATGPCESAELARGARLASAFSYTLLAAYREA